MFALPGAGCAVVPRAQMDECQRLGQTLRSENARLQDRVLTLQNQNRDYADRAVDDSRRLAVQDEAITRLEQSVQAYQDDRDRLESAYRRLASNVRDLHRSDTAIDRTEDRGKAEPPPGSARPARDPAEAAASESKP
jgi:chromosome segregation ATPase